MDERPAVRGLWIFSIIWLGRLVSFLGSSLTGFALGIWVYQRMGSATQGPVKILGFCFTPMCEDVLNGEGSGRDDAFRLKALSLRG